MRIPSTARYVAPFVLFMALLLAAPNLPLSPAWELPLRSILLAGVCVVCWPRELNAIPSQPLLSIIFGIAVFVLWIAPDVLVHGYRSLPLFSNSIVGHVHSTLPAAALRSNWVLFWRTLRAALIVPVVEELFWRGWLMRWLIDRDFLRVPLGAYARGAFWITALLFASEHGPYWDVGLLAGALYNYWLIRTKNLADCILAHGITNLCLSLYVIAFAQWQYWQ